MNVTGSTRALSKAIELVGGQVALSKKLGVTQQTISYWLTTSKKVPAEFAKPIEEATGGTVTRKQLRPEIYSDTQN
jgi:DNA-binding transcriptional regulator YdaS (Cro superfamily)